MIVETSSPGKKKKKAISTLLPAVSDHDYRV
jgi:hypothetical protein